MKVMSILAIPRVKTDDSKQFYCLNIVLKNKNGPLVSEFSREKRDFTLPWYQNYWITTIGSLSNQEGDTNENSKKNPRGLGPVYMKVGDPK